MSLAASRPRRRWVAGLALGIAAAAIIGFGLTRLHPQAADQRAVRFPIHAPKETGFWGVWAFSPDGSTLAFIAAGKGPSSVWLRPMSSMEARSVRGTENADSVFWSPDGKSLGFFASGRLWRVSASGGVPVPLCDVAKEPTQLGTWGADERILFSPETGEAIYRVSSSGGTPSQFVRADRAKGETQVLWPHFLPDGRRFLYLRRDARGGMLMLAAPDGSARAIFPVLSRVEYMEPGYLVFSREQTLLARSFDAESGSLAGEPLSLAEGVAYEMKNASSRFASSRNGAIAYQLRGVFAQERLAWFDRSGKVEEVGRTLGSTFLAIDPQGRRALFSRQRTDTMNRSLWIMDLERKVETRVTADETSETDGRWLPDGKSIVYAAEVGGLLQLRRRDLETGKVTALLPPSVFQEAGPVMPGGAELSYTVNTDAGVAVMRRVSLSGDQKSSAFIQAEFNEGGVQISPDGRFVAFARDDSVRGDEIYVAPIGNPEQRIRISRAGAKHGTCLWSRSGQEIFYLSFSRQLMAVPIRTEPSLSTGEPTVLLTFKEGADWEYFDVSPDGKRFLALVPEAEVPQEEHPINVVLNWPAEAAAQAAGRP
jgi:Tol biopolymer transport system component